MAPLTGFAIGITGDRRAAEQAEMLTRRGAEVVHGPVLRTVALDDVDVTTRATTDLLAGPVDVIVLTTGVGTRSWLGVAESSGIDDALRSASRQALVLARGPKARSAAIGGGLDVAWQAPGETSGEIVEYLAELGVTGKRIAVQRDGGGNIVAERIRALGADVVDVPVYRWQLPDDEEPAQRLIASTVAGRIDALTFTSAVAVDNIFELAGDPDALAAGMNGPARAIAVGPVTAGALRRHGVDRVVEPPRARLGAMIQCLVTELSSLRRSLRHGPARATWQGCAVLVGEAPPTMLTAGEARVLRLLVANAPSVVPKSALAEAGADEHAAEVAVARLRTKLGPLGGGIRTVPRRGYACVLESSPLSD